LTKKKKKDSPPILSNYILMYLNSLLKYPLVLGCTKPSYLYPDLSNVLIANSLATCNQTVASPDCVLNVVNSMKINNVRLINQNVPKISAKNKTILFVFSVSESMVTLVNLTLGLFAGLVEFLSPL
jgi:hypothetical protein